MLQKRIFTILLYYIIIVSFNYNYAQNNYKYAGFIKIQDTLLIKYKIEFNENNGLIDGYSFTDFGGIHETKSRIKGIYDSEHREISFSEVGLLYTKSPVSMDDFDFCNVNFQKSKFKLGSDKLSGNFKGKFGDGTNCLDGEIAMSSVEKIAKRVSKFTKKVQKSKRIEDSIKQKALSIKIIDTLNLNILKKNEITSIPTKSSKIKLRVFDAGQIDDDVVTIYKNGKVLLSKYRINSNKKELVVSLTEGKTQIKIVSNSEGTIGSNTAMIELIDGDHTIKTMTNLKKGEVTKIDFIKI